jgi:hypothetical protein
MSRVTDQEIIFESNDIEEYITTGSSSFTNRNGDVTNNENILSSSLNPLEAFQYFQKFSIPIEGKHYYQLNPNISSRSSHTIESPWEKYYRLKTELEELKTDLNSIEITQNEKKETIWSVLQKKTQSLLDESNQLSNHSAWKSISSSSSSSSASADLKSDLLQEILTSFASSSSKESESESKQQQVEIVKSIYSSVSSSFSQRLLTLEKKITALETILGMEGNDLILNQSFSASSSSSSSSFPLLSTISRLEQKVSLLDPMNYENYRSKISFLKIELESFSSHLSSSSNDPKSGGEGGGGGGSSNLMEIYHKIEGFLEQYSLLETMINEIPQLILRLKTLENIHWNANQFIGRLGSLEDEILQINKDLQSNSSVLQELKGTLVESFTSMKENIEQIENKFSSKR